MTPVKIVLCAEQRAMSNEVHLTSITYIGRIVVKSARARTMGQVGAISLARDEHEGIPLDAMQLEPSDPKGF